jgi:hypothetical protein
VLDSSQAIASALDDRWGPLTGGPHSICPWRAGFLFQGLPEEDFTVKPRKPLTSIDQAGRQRTCNLMALFGVSRPTVYRWMDAGKLPKPDGWVGRHPYWLNETLRPYVGGTAGRANN